MSGDYIGMHFDLSGADIVATYTEVLNGQKAAHVRRFGSKWTVRDIFHHEIENYGYRNWPLVGAQPPQNPTHGGQG